LRDIPYRHIEKTTITYVKSDVGDHGVLKFVILSHIPTDVNLSEFKATPAFAYTCSVSIFFYINWLFLRYDKLSNVWCRVISKVEL